MKIDLQVDTVDFQFDVADLYLSCIWGSVLKPLNNSNESRSTIKYADSVRYYYVNEFI